MVRAAARVRALVRGKHEVDLGIERLDGSVEVTPVVGVDEVSDLVDVLLRHAYAVSPRGPASHVKRNAACGRAAEPPLLRERDSGHKHPPDRADHVDQREHEEQCADGRPDRVLVDRRSRRHRWRGLVGDRLPPSSQAGSSYVLRFISASSR